MRIPKFTKIPNQLAIRLFRKGCANRPFYHIIVSPIEKHSSYEGIEQLGVYDPMPNERDEKLLSLNVERFKYYVAQGAWVRASVGQLLGVAGVMPIHPQSLTVAWRNRKRSLESSENSTESNSNSTP
ncbi:probable 28S ribosomal protein S16, mitochondrial [Uloborus diversus]|uniref:probable 28S ribosomal protein S16, mitochondrial n=1 Tax=Uloborus diversus TaxID=327109 RepID=UPI002408FAD7|nr:probable 28S ribosomal protein S16, mitochondrial [Uloborus diversus]